MVFPLSHGIIAGAVNSVTGNTPFNHFNLEGAGVWYDFADLDTMFQDDAGTVPVTSHNDPVRLVLDKSGNGLHGVATDTDNPPVYIVDAEGIAQLLCSPFTGIKYTVPTPVAEPTQHFFSTKGMVPLFSGQHRIISSGPNQKLENYFGGLRVYDGNYVSISSSNNSHDSIWNLSFDTASPSSTERKTWAGTLVNSTHSTYTSGMANNVTSWSSGALFSSNLTGNIREYIVFAGASFSEAVKNDVFNHLLIGLGRAGQM